MIPCAPDPRATGARVPYGGYRNAARHLAARLGLRVLTFRKRGGYWVLALWPADGFARELADPPTYRNWAGVWAGLVALKPDA